ncbi:MAG: TIGR03084 family metal-binding protein [Acidimicrobiales bacterium]
MADRDSYDRLLADLAAEHHDLDALVASLDDDGWEAPTPAAGWAVRDQIGHLTFYDGRAVVALTEPAAFVAGAEEMVAAVTADPSLAPDLDEARTLRPGELLEWWRAERGRLLAAMTVAEPASRVPWYGPAMSAVSFATARLMETWAHGQDVADALGVTRLPSARLRHVAHIGVRAAAFNFASHGLDTPTAPIRVELRGPDHDVWTWGPEEATDRVRGSALDFCLVVTQRRHIDDTRVEVEGPAAAAWMEIAQAFAGPPGPGRVPGEFAAS